MTRGALCVVCTIALSAVALTTELEVTHVDLVPHFNNKATAPFGQLAGFNDGKEAYPVDYLPSGIFTDDGFTYNLPNFNSTSADNVNCSAQVIAVPKGRYLAPGWPGATDGYHATINAQMTAVYADGTNETPGFVVDPFYGIYPSVGPIGAPMLTSQHADGTVYENKNMSSIFSFQHALDNSKALESVVLLNQTATSTYFGKARVHMFALSLASSTLKGSSWPMLGVQNVRSTTKFRGNDTRKVQLVEGTLNNFVSRTAGPEAWITREHTIELKSGSVKTFMLGRFKRLRGGDQARVIVGIVNNPNTPPGSPASVTVHVKVAQGQLAIQPPPVARITAGIPSYSDDDDSLRTHEAPGWFDGAKFGLFIHWGAYSVPAWTVSGTQYAEYHYWLHNPANESSAVWKQHRQVWGEDFVYDDFFPLFTAEHWDAANFVKFVADIGAKYYVFTTKHHEGFALFDTRNSSNRNSLKYGPKRDIIRELVDATKKTQPQLYSGLYFSLPEWYNPAYVKYANDAGSNGQYSRRGKNGTVGYDIIQKTGFPGGPAKNVYNSSEIEPYTGYIDVGDFVEDIQKPQMKALLYDYGADILWCDIGMATAYPELATDWYNSVMKEGRQVAVNVRCGANYSDFDTPEYSKTTNLERRKWESSEGSDPYSANGSIHNSLYTSLMEVGKWLNASGEAIYDTQYWFMKSQEADLRFTTKPDAFYITSLSRPTNGSLRSSSRLPVRPGDIAYLGPNGESAPLKWRWTEDDMFEIDVKEDLLVDTDYAWSFKLRYV